MTVYEFIEDFDNAELDEYEFIEQLREAVVEFNEIHNTDYDPGRTVRQYLSRKREAKYGEN